jgi:probable HAF family extracellular repeat protein
MKPQTPGIAVAVAAMVTMMAIAVGDVEAAPRYVATRIPYPADYNTSADAISASGDIAGNVTLIDVEGYESDEASFVFTADNQVRPIVLPAALVGLEATTHALGINSRGVVVGRVNAEVGRLAFWYANGGADGRVGEPDTAVVAINEDSALAGTQDGTAFVASDKGGIPMPRSNSAAFAINAHGDIAGGFQTSVARYVVNTNAFRFRNGQFEDLGALGRSAYAAAINTRGDVVGTTFSNDDVQRPFIVTDGPMRYLGDIYGKASAINAAGTVVGIQYGPIGWRIFIYSDGVFSNLEDLVDGLGGARLVAANAINDAGQIAAQACAYSLGMGCFGLRLDPVPAR